MFYHGNGTADGGGVVYWLTGEVLTRFTNLQGGPFPANDWKSACFSKEEHHAMIQYLNYFRESAQRPLLLSKRPKFSKLDVIVTVPITPLSAECIFVRTTRPLPLLSEGAKTFLPDTGQPAIIAAVRFGRRAEIYLFALVQSEIDAIHLACKTKKIENDVWFQCNIQRTEELDIDAN